MLPLDFNYIDYIALNRDLHDFNESEAIEHYLNIGIYEKRIYNFATLPHDFKYFDYLELNSDIKALQFNEYQCKVHYLNYGIHEKREYSISKCLTIIPDDFEPEKYILYNDDLQHLTYIQAIAHYIYHGIKENRMYKKSNSIDTIINNKIIDKTTVEDIREFKILGERCSGTNYLEELMTTNFNCRYRNTDFHKHFFCFDEKIQKEKCADKNIIYIGIVRNIYDWIYSFYNNPHNVDKNIIHNMYDFISKEFSSYNIVNDTPVLIKQDINHTTGEKYKNIFECRKIKNNFLLHIAPEIFDNYILIRYEDLRDNTDTILDVIKNKFNLKMKQQNYIHIDYYKKNKNKKFIKSTYELVDFNIKKYIQENIHIHDENKLGYIY